MKRKSIGKNFIEVFDDEGNLIEKKSAAEGLVVNGVLLGIPLEIDGDHGGIGSS